jgi:hypothetical protein
MRKVEALSRGPMNKPSKRRLTDADDIELKSSLQQLALNLGGDAIKTNIAVRVNSRSSHCFRLVYRGGLDKYGRVVVLVLFQKGA